MNQVVARKDGKWVIISLTPDVCLTPMGSVITPVPYPIVAQLSKLVQTTTSVFANGLEIFVFNSSKVSQCTGDEAGTNKGIMSGTVGKEAWAKDKADKVFAEGCLLVRVNDLCWMNGNGPGSAVAKKAAQIKETQARIKAGKHSDDPEVREAAASLDAQLKKLEMQELMRSARNPECAPPEGWNRDTSVLSSEFACFKRDPALMAYLSDEGTTRYSYAVVGKNADILDKSEFIFSGPHTLSDVETLQGMVQKAREEQMFMEIANTRFKFYGDGKMKTVKRALTKQEYDDECLAKEIKVSKAQCAALLDQMPTVPKPPVVLLGNTQGVLNAQPAPGGTAAGANPVVIPETPEEDSWWDDFGEWVHVGLDAVGLSEVPIVAWAADALNALIYACEGDTGNALTSLVAIIPGVGIGAISAKYGAKMYKYGEKANKGYMALRGVEAAVISEDVASTITSLPDTYETIKKALETGDVNTLLLETTKGAMGAAQNINTIKDVKNIPSEKLELPTKLAKKDESQKGKSAPKESKPQPAADKPSPVQKVEEIKLLPPGKQPLLLENGVRVGKNASVSLLPSKFMGKTPSEIDKLAVDMGLVRKGPDPMNGKGSYLDPETGKARLLIHPDATKGYTPHFHVNNFRGERLNIDGVSVGTKTKGAHLPLLPQ